LADSYDEDEDNSGALIESIVLEITKPDAPPPPDSEGEEDTTTTTTEATTTTGSEDNSGDTTSDPASDVPPPDVASNSPDNYVPTAVITVPVISYRTTAPVTTVSTTAPVTTVSTTAPGGDSVATESSPPDTQIVAESLLSAEKNPPTGAAFPISLMIALSIICIVITVVSVGFHSENK
jgi:hypothetical protein